MEEVGRIYAYPIGPGGVVISIESSLVVSLARPEKVAFSIVTLSLTLCLSGLLIMWRRSCQSLSPLHVTRLGALSAGEVQIYFRMVIILVMGSKSSDKPKVGLPL